MAGEFTLGDVIRKARMARRWNQTRLGVEAGKYQLRSRDVAINKSTVSKVEKDPYTSEFGTVWRLLAALQLKFSDVEKRVGHPFLDSIQHTRVSGSHTSALKAGAPSGVRAGHALAESDAQNHPVPRPATSARGQLLESFKKAKQEIDTREARATRQSPAAPRARAAVSGARARKPRR